MDQAEDESAILLEFYNEHRHLLVNYEDFYGFRFLANGSYSDVYRAYLTWEGQEMEVACKELRVMRPSDGTSSRNIYKRLALELHVWVTKLLDENYVLPIFRFSINSRNNYPILITKLMPNGNLKEYLRRKREEPVDFMSIINHIAAGLNYLHEAGVTHGDLKCGNILMSSDDVPKPLLTDFGIAHVLNPGTVTLQLITDSENARGTTQYMAKEMISGDSSRENFYTKAADVWAFGMTVYEIITGVPPYNNFRRDPMIIIAIHDGKLPVWPDNDSNLHISLRGRGVMEQLKPLCARCWKDADDRPSMREIMGMLESFSR